MMRWRCQCLATPVEKGHPTEEGVFLVRIVQMYQYKYTIATP